MPDILDPEPAPMLEEIVPPEVRYDEAVSSQQPAAIDRAWADLAASGVRPTTARVYPPTDPTGGRSTHESVQWIGAQVDPSTVNEVADMAVQYNIPMAQAAAAIDAQMRFQAQRGYQKDLEGGMEATEAMAKWGPALFASGARGRYGGMGQFPQRKFMNVGGVGYFVDPMTGTAKPVTPERPPVVKDVIAAQGAVNLHKSYIDEIGKVQTAIDKQEIDKGEGLRRIRNLMDQMQSFQQEHPEVLSRRPNIQSPVATPTPASAAPITPTAARVAPAQAIAPATVTSKAQFEALPSGSIYIGQDGRRYRKP